jgi:Na+/melibiose symporter-like transporter
LNQRATGQIVGGVLIIIAIILGVVQHFGGINLYGDESNKWYFYGLVGLIGLIGIIIAAWSSTRQKEAQPQQPQQPQQQPEKQAQP